MLQVFYLDVAYVAQLYTYVASVSSNVLVVSNVCCKCFIWMLHILQTYVINVSSVLDVCYNKCFMLQVFHE
jgi:hypothetical protein